MAIYTTRFVILAPSLEILYFHPNHTGKDQFSDDYHYIHSIKNVQGHLELPLSVTLTYRRQEHKLKITTS